MTNPVWVMAGNGMWPSWPNATAGSVGSAYLLLGTLACPHDVLRVGVRCATLCTSVYVRAWPQVARSLYHVPQPHPLRPQGRPPGLWALH